MFLPPFGWHCSLTVNTVHRDSTCYTHTDTHTHTHPFNGPLSGTTQVSRYQKGKTNLDFTEARDSEWQWNQLGRMQVCTSLQTDNHASTPPLSFFTGQMPFLPPNQQRQSTEGSWLPHSHASTPPLSVINWDFIGYMLTAECWSLDTYV